MIRLRIKRRLMIILELVVAAGFAFAVCFIINSLAGISSGVSYAIGTLLGIVLMIALEQNK